MRKVNAMRKCEVARRLAAAWLTTAGITAMAFGPAFALDVMVNQVGYEPEGPKIFRVQRSTDFAGAGSFSVKRSSDNAVVCSGTLTRRGGLWDKFYWEGDFSLFRTTGDYYISATVDAESANSYGFTIAASTILSQTGALVYQYFWTQRCGCNVPGWHGPCHLDDGLRSDNSVHVDAVGGWHDAGDYNKFPHGFAGDGVFALLWLYDSNRSHFDSIDVIDSNGQNGSNGIADILDEATYQARWLAKMVLPDGHVMRQTRMRRIGASWVRPESDTDNTVGNWDDRWIDPGDENTPQEIVCCASLIKMHRILASKGLSTENFGAKALAIWNHRVALAQSEGGHNNLGNDALQVFAGLDLYAVYGQQNCWDRALQRVAEMANTSISNPSCYDSSAEGAGYGVGAMAWFARNYPNEYCSQAARDGVAALMSHYISLADNPMGLIKRYLNGQYTHFESNSDWNAFYLGINRCYLLCAWGAMESYRLLHDPAYVRFAMDQYGWVMGANYNRVCMMEGTGYWNLPRYHSRYDKLPGHSDGAQPGCVPNGYVQYYATGLPYIDLSTNRYQTNEGWLINNAAYAMALSQMHDLDEVAPSPVTGFSAVGEDGQISLSWTNPADADFTSTVIRYSTSGYPAGPSDGALVVDRANSPGSSDSVVHTGLDSEKTYYYSAFARDSASNCSSAAHANATPIGEICFHGHFSYPDADLNGNGGWSGSAMSQITVANSMVRILGGAGSYDSVQTMNCAAVEGGLLGVHIRAKKGAGTSSLWNLWIDDAAGKNLGRWFGTGSVVRGRIGTGVQLTATQNLTGGWDDLYVKITPSTNQTQFIFNGSPIGTYSHTETGASDAIGRIRLERIDCSSASGQYVYLDDLKMGFADTTAPVATVGAPSALLTRTGPVGYTVNTSEPVFALSSASDIQINATGNAAAGTTTVNGSGSGPYNVTLSNISGGGTLGITVKSGACADVAGNVNTASAPSQTFTVLAQDGSIASARSAANSAALSLANKPLYYLSTGVGYIEEPGRWSGIRIEGSIPASVGQNVLLTGTKLTTTEGEPYVLLSLLEPAGAGSVGPLAASNAALRQPIAGGLYVKTWGTVQPGSVTDNSFVLSDGSSADGIKVLTPSNSGVVDGQFVIVEGAAGWDGHRVIYAR